MMQQLILNRKKLILCFIAIFIVIFVVLNKNINEIQLDLSGDYYIEGYGLCIDNCHVVELTEENILKINELLKEFEETKDNNEHDKYYYRRIAIKSSNVGIVIIMGNYIIHNNKKYIATNTNLYNYLDELIKNENLY